MDNEWKNNEGFQPVDDGIMVAVEYRDGGLDEDDAEMFDWAFHGDEDDIVSYKVLSDD